MYFHGSHTKSPILCVFITKSDYSRKIKCYWFKKFSSASHLVLNGLKRPDFAHFEI